MPRFALSSLALFLAAASVLVAQELPRIATPPSLPFGLKWTMAQREALAALERACGRLELTGEGERFSRGEVRRIAREQGLSERTVRDGATWREYSAEGVRADSALPAGRVRVEFLRGRILRVRFTFRTSSDEEHVGFAEILRARFNGLYGSRGTDDVRTMPAFPSGEIEGMMSMTVGAIGGDEEYRPPIYTGWAGVVGRTMYGTEVYTIHPARLCLLYATGPAPTPARFRPVR